ncbi:glycoside hydrolase family 95 protein [Rickenella mellea]|uniref:Glycoside hydrolase family 95 protein n=1 Tax=Rickenella mellea TaxID=50990 RepID=A0A4Y7QHK6_9AGAM|nr:glycoside hydrolase family 95 protein [Rickenella mellea]
MGCAESFEGIGCRSSRPRHISWVSRFQSDGLRTLELMKTVLPILAVLVQAIGTFSAPAGFPSSGNGLWYTTQGNVWGRSYLLIGNGYLGASSSGGTTTEAIFLNIESLWQGGPFQDPTYNGGNKAPSTAAANAKTLASVRQTILTNGTASGSVIEPLSAAIGVYGSYASPGQLVTTLVSPGGSQSNYGRFLDMDAAKFVTTWAQNGTTFTREAFCSHPAQACVQHTRTSPSAKFTETYAFASLTGLPAPNVTCSSSNTMLFRGLASSPGMTFEILASVKTTGGTVSCSTAPAINGTTLATVTVTGATESWITWVGGTNYDMNAGDAAHNFSFQGVDPHDGLVTLLAGSANETYSALLAAHNADYTATARKFKLDIGQTADMTTPTDVLKDAYSTTNTNPYLEWLAFNFGRYLLFSSSRGALPANLQGKWSNDAKTSWGADYHSNINIQMNYWSAESTNLDVTKPLFDYIEKTWAPRGAQTAQILYNITQGWVTHDEMNIFGHTGMKSDGNDARWADYTESAVWMMVHVWDHFDYSNDVAWWKSQGYPLVKGVAQFHLARLQDDTYFKDGTLIVAPCNSPEQDYMTLACAHSQQLIWQMLNAILKGASAAGETDTAFLNDVQTKVAKMDKGIHIGSWGQLQEWKIDRDSQNDTHRHLSHLIGVYPGYAVSSYSPTIQASAKNYTRAQVLNAATTSLIARGNGTGPDADAGWEKAWRAACWAQFQNATEFYFELTYTLDRNLAENLMSMYSPASNPLLQIDANLGYPGALMNALLQSPDVPTLSTPLVITLLPALPSKWATGSITGARARGAITVDLTWSAGKPTKAVFTVDAGAISRPVQVVYRNKVVASFTTKGGYTKTITSF